MNNLYKKILLWTVKAFQPEKQWSALLSLDTLVSFMRMTRRGQRGLNGILFLTLQEISAVGYYLFHGPVMFAVRRMEQLNCLPIDCDH